MSSLVDDLNVLQWVAGLLVQRRIRQHLVVDASVGIGLAEGRWCRSRRRPVAG